MLQTNPMTPSKTPVASGARSFMKASCPIPPPFFPIRQPSICCPRPLGEEERGRAGLAVTAFKGRSTAKGVGGEEGN